MSILLLGFQTHSEHVKTCSFRIHGMILFFTHQNVEYFTLNFFGELTVELKEKLALH